MVYHPQDTTLAFVPLNVRPTFMSTSDVHVQVCFISKIGASRVSTYTIFNIPKNAPSPYIHAACAPATRSDGRPRATHATYVPATSSSIHLHSAQDGRRCTFYIKNKKQEVGRREARHEHDEGFRRLLTRTPDAGRRRRCNSGVNANDRGQEMTRLIEGRA